MDAGLPSRERAAPDNLGFELPALRVMRDPGICPVGGVLV